MPRVPPAQPVQPDPSTGGPSPWAHIGPNWFASVMGTGIVAVALVSLPFSVPGARVLATGIWVLAVLLFLLVLGATVQHHRTHPATARGHLVDPVLSHFHGAPAMALMTLGAGAVLVGSPVVGDTAALVLGWSLWGLGTALGLVVACVVPRLMVPRLRGTRASGVWLMSVVAPMVSAAVGALLLDHCPPGAAQRALWLFCVACAALAGCLAVVVVVLVVRSVSRYGVGPAAATPTLFIVLGPLGQSITAVHHLGVRAPAVWGDSFGRSAGADLGEARRVVLDLGVPLLVIALAWAVVAVAVVVRTARGEGLGFSLTWWSFTFPVGTVLTGVSGLTEVAAPGLGRAVGLGLAALLGVALVAVWALVLVRTVAGVVDRSLLRAPTPPLVGGPAPGAAPVPGA